MIKKLQRGCIIYSWPMVTVELAGGSPRLDMFLILHVYLYRLVIRDNCSLHMNRVSPDTQVDYTRPVAHRDTGNATILSPKIGAVGRYK